MATFDEAQAMTQRELYPSEKQDRFIVRLPDGMRDRIKAAAEAKNRSMNAEIVATLEEKYPAQDLSLDKFFEEYFYPAAGEKDPVTQERMVAVGNAVLEAANSDMRMWIDANRIGTVAIGTMWEIEDGKMVGKFTREKF